MPHVKQPDWTIEPWERGIIAFENLGTVLASENRMPCLLSTIRLHDAVTSLLHKALAL